MYTQLVPKVQVLSVDLSLSFSFHPPDFGIFSPANDGSLTELTALMGKAPSI